MSEELAPVRQERLAHPAGPAIKESDAYREQLQSATKARQRLLARGREIAQEMAEEQGAVTEEELADLREMWPLS